MCTTVPNVYERENRSGVHNVHGEGLTPQCARPCTMCKSGRPSDGSPAHAVRASRDERLRRRRMSGPCKHDDPRAVTEGGEGPARDGSLAEWERTRDLQATVHGESGVERYERWDRLDTSTRRASTTVD